MLSRITTRHNDHFATKEVGYTAFCSAQRTAQKHHRSHTGQVITCIQSCISMHVPACKLLKVLDLTIST